MFYKARAQFKKYLADQQGNKSDRCFAEKILHINRRLWGRIKKGELPPYFTLYCLTSLAFPESKDTIFECLQEHAKEMLAVKEGKE